MDQLSFGEVYRTLYAPLFRFVYTRVKDRALAEDITQDTFVVFLKVHTTFRAGAALPYLHTVARNKVIDHMRKKRPDLDDDSLFALASDAPTPEESAVLGEELSLVLSALATLSPAEEAAIRLKYLDGLTTAEIAQYLEKSEEAVRQLLSRGLARVRAYTDRI